MEKTKFEILSELIKADRSYRRFDEKDRIESETISDIVELARYCASGRNLQSMRYYIINDVETCDMIFPHLKWAGYLPEWDGPEEGERPAAYLIQCNDKNITKNYLCDDGLQLQAITLGAVAKGLGCCIIKSFNALKLKEILNIPDHLEALYVLAIGKPVEKVEIEDLKGEEGEDIKYYRTADGVHHVPKRLLKDLIVNIQPSIP